MTPQSIADLGNVHCGSVFAVVPLFYIPIELPVMIKKPARNRTPTTPHHNKPRLRNQPPTQLSASQRYKPHLIDQ